MKRFLSIFLLASFCVLQAAPMAEFSQAIETSDVKTVQNLLANNVLTEKEALELLNHANLILGIHQGGVWSSIERQESLIRFYASAGSALLITLMLSKKRDFFLSSGSFLFMIASSLMEYEWQKSGKQKIINTYTSAITVQHLIYKALLDVQYSVKEKNSL